MKKFLLLVSSTLLLAVVNCQAQVGQLETFSQIPSTFSPVVGQVLNTQSGYAPGIAYGYISNTLCASGQPQGGLENGAGGLAAGLGIGCNYQVTQTDVDNGYIKNVVKMIAADSVTVLASKTFFIWMTGVEVSYQLAISGDSFDTNMNKWGYNMTVYITNIGSRNINQVSCSLGNTIMTCPQQLLFRPNNVIMCTGFYDVRPAQVTYAITNGIIPFTTNITTYAPADGTSGVNMSITSDYIQPLVILASTPSTFSAASQTLSISALVFGDSSSIYSIAVPAKPQVVVKCSNVSISQNGSVRNCSFTYLTQNMDMVTGSCLPSVTYVSYNDKVTRQYSQSSSVPATTITRVTYVPYMRSIATAVKPNIVYVANNNNSPVNVSWIVNNNGGIPITLIPPTGYTCNICATCTLAVKATATCGGVYNPTSTDLVSGYAGLPSRVVINTVAQSQSIYGIGPGGTYVGSAVFTLKLDSLSLLSSYSSCIIDNQTSVANVTLYIVNSGATSVTNLLLGTVDNSSGTPEVVMLPSNVCGSTVSGVPHSGVIPCSFSYDISNVEEGTTISLVATDSSSNIVQSLGDLDCISF
jgi:hypothetical protein